MISGYLCLVCNVSCSPLPGTYDQAYRLINRYNNNNYLMELDQIMHRRRLWARKLKTPPLGFSTMHTLVHYLVANYPSPKAEGYSSVHVQPSVCLSFHPTVFLSVRKYVARPGIEPRPDCATRPGIRLPEEGYHLTPSKIFKDRKECVRIKAVP